MGSKAVVQTDSNGLALAWVYIPMGISLQNDIFREVLRTVKATPRRRILLNLWEAESNECGGGECIMELTTNGDVVSWGGNQYGELGDYTFLDSTTGSRGGIDQCNKNRLRLESLPGD